MSWARTRSSRKSGGQLIGRRGDLQRELIERSGGPAIAHFREVVPFDDQRPQVSRIDRQCLFRCREGGRLVVEANASVTEGRVNRGIRPARGDHPFE